MRALLSQQAAALGTPGAAAALFPVCPARARAGFTLAELLVAMTLMAILAAIAAPRYANSVANYRASLAARQIAADLALAKSTARATSASQKITFDTSNQRYTITGQSGLNNTSTTYTVNLSKSPFHAALSTVTLPTAATALQICFDGYGNPDTSASITVRSGNASRIVTLDSASGATTVQ